MTVLFVLFAVSVSYFANAKDVPAGLTSVRKCNEYHNANFTFSQLTQKELDLLTDEDKEKIGDRILGGGENELPKRLPLMASLGYDNGDLIQTDCGGALISKQFVVTAAHCIFSLTWGKVKYIRLGDIIDNKGVQTFEVDEIYIHPDYKYPIKYNDIALIKLDEPVVFTEYVSPACLEPKRVDIRDKTYFAAGWGFIGHGEGISDDLQVGKLKHFSGSLCNKMFLKGSSLSEGIKVESQICARGLRPKTDTCEGDSGGPLVYKDYFSEEKFVYFLAGVTSFGKTCIHAGVPTVYSRVAYYTDWIEKIVWKEEFNSNGTVSDRI